VIELQKAIFNAMKADSELLNLLGLDPAVTEADISKRLLPASPQRLAEDCFIHFWQPISSKSRRNFLFENRNIQFRIFDKDESLSNQQTISERLQFIFVGNDTEGGAVQVPSLQGYEDIEYVAEGAIPGVTGSGHYGWYLELIFQNVVKYSR